MCVTNPVPNHHLKIDFSKIVDELDQQDHSNQFEDLAKLLVLYDIRGMCSSLYFLEVLEHEIHIDRLEQTWSPD